MSADTVTLLQWACTMWFLHMLVRLISHPDRAQRLDGIPSLHSDRGRPTDSWLVGPYGNAI
jgi:hypothetical protein